LPKNDGTFKLYELNEKTKMQTDQCQTKSNMYDLKETKLRKQNEIVRLIFLL